MTVPNRSIIAKGLFAVSVVAVTAVVGSVGFAQADHRGGRGAGDGYGGTGALVRAAIAQFESAVASAQTKFTTDINACLTQYRAPSSAGTNLRNQNNRSISNFRSFTANPARVSENETVLNRNLTSEADRARHDIDDNTNRFYADLDRSHFSSNRNQLSQCLRTASNTFRDSVRTAQQQLNDALRNILHRRS